jgi:hypothetical protein
VKHGPLVDIQQVRRGPRSAPLFSCCGYAQLIHRAAEMAGTHSSVGVRRRTACLPYYRESELWCWNVANREGKPAQR